MSKTFEQYKDTYINPQGPGDARPTALDIIKNEGLLKHGLDGKVILITGCSGGIGLESARVLYRAGAHVYATARDLKRMNEAVEGIKKEGGSGQITILELELDHLASIRKCAHDFLQRSSRLDVFVANAGVMATPEGQTKDGFETQIGTNHVGHFLLLQLLLPVLKSSAKNSPARVIFVSSTGHRICPPTPEDLKTSSLSNYNPWLQYGKSKTANVWTANEVERRYGNENVHGISLHPGVITSDLAGHMSEEERKSWGPPDVQKIYMNNEQGAALTVFAAVSKEWEGKGGKLLMEFGEAELVPEETAVHMVGRSAWAYDRDAAEKFWDASLAAVKL